MTTEEFSKQCGKHLNENLGRCLKCFLNDGCKGWRTFYKANEASISINNYTATKVEFLNKWLRKKKLEKLLS